MELSIKTISKQYKGNFWGLRDFSLTLSSGVLALLGPNGAGKSTLMRILATITQPTSGSVTWNGMDIIKSPDELRAVLGYLPQDFGVYPNLNAVEFLEYIAALKGLDRRAARKRITELLEVVNLFDVRNRPLGGYSGGMKQRVGIAQALLNDPQLLIVDEPTVGLDPEERVRFRNLISDLAGQRIVILSTHIVSDAEATATEIAVINHGRLIQYTAPERMLQVVDGKVWEWVIASEDLAAKRQNLLISGTLRRGDGVHVRVVAVESPGGRRFARHANAGGRLSLSLTRSARAGQMNATFYTLFHLMRADFLERVRRYSFLIVLGLVGYAGYLFVPPAGAAYATLVRGSYRALYNSAGVGNLFGSVAVIFLSLFGFYLVKNAIARDYQTGVGQIIATTPISKPVYLLGKWLSNLAVLTVILAVLTIMALVMQVVRVEAPQVDFWKLLAPIWLMGLPVLAIWSAFAVAFESIPFLRGGFGNVVAFFLWAGILGS